MLILLYLAWNISCPKYEIENKLLLCMQGYESVTLIIVLVLFLVKYCLNMNMVWILKYFLTRHEIGSNNKILKPLFYATSRWHIVVIFTHCLIHGVFKIYLVIELIRQTSLSLFMLSHTFFNVEGYMDGGSVK